MTSRARVLRWLIDNVERAVPLRIQRARPRLALVVAPEPSARPESASWWTTALTAEEPIRHCCDPRDIYLA